MKAGFEKERNASNMICMDMCHNQSHQVSNGELDLHRPMFARIGSLEHAAIYE
jgi:hypothetical protein